MKLLVMKNYFSFDLSFWLNCQIAAFHMQATLVRVATTIFSVATLLRHCLNGYNIVSSLKGCVVLKIVVANRPV